MRYVAFDVETTGLWPSRGHRIIEVGAVGINSWEVVEEFQSLIDIGMRIPKSVQKIHGISDEMLVGQPKLAEVMSRFYRFINGAVLIAHNAMFDFEFLQHEFHRVGLRLSNRIICTLQLSQRNFQELPNHRLDTVYTHLYGQMPDGSQHHRALDDARLVAKVWLAIKTREGGLDLPEHLNPE